MKNSYILPALTAVVGFAVAWVAKPGASPAQVSGGGEKQEKAAPVRSGPSSSRPQPEDSKRPKEVKAGDFPLMDQADLGPKTRDEARMLRLSEALGLTLDQQGAIISIVEQVQSKADGNVPVIRDMTTRGNVLEQELAKILSPEQMAKFQEMRVRERENRAETRALRMLNAAIEDIDLSPDQREQVLERLRQKAKADMQAIPAAATLLLDKSMLPTNNKELSVDGVLLLAKMDEEVASTDGAEAHQKVLDTQRQEQEDILECYHGILTSGQMGQYQAAMHEQRQVMDRMPRPDMGEDATTAPPPQDNQGNGSMLRPEQQAGDDTPEVIHREEYYEEDDDEEPSPPMPNLGGDDE